MKNSLIVGMLCFSFNSFSYTVIDSLYEPISNVQSERTPASSGLNYCIMDAQGRTFAKSCYSSMKLCDKRLEFWKDLPGVSSSKCVSL